MLPSILAVEEVTILSPVLVDDRGTLVPDWTLPPARTRVVTGCSVQPAGATESVGGRQQTQSNYKAWLPMGEPVAAADRIVWRGRVFNAANDSEVWHDPLNNLDHQTVDLEEQRG